MASLKNFTLALALAVAINGAAGADCVVKSQRKAWHTFTDVEKKAYIDAELCLMEIPATLGLPGAKTRFDELQANHQIQATSVHGVLELISLYGAFLPYHRLLMHAHEYFMKTECGFTGAQPYWDEPREAGKFSSSILFDPVTGFGGNGQGANNCIADGPFANYTNHLGPGYVISDHCIDRVISDNSSRGSSQANVDACNVYTTFERAWPCIEGSPHSGGHGGVGGEMVNPISSPGDPLFYLHHTWLDKVWWDWQALDLPARLTDMSGRNVQDPNAGFPGPGNGTGGFPPFPTGGFPFPSGGFPPRPTSTTSASAVFLMGANMGLVKRDGDPGNVTTLNHVLNMMGLIPNATIADVMDIGGGYLCYEYV